MLSTVWLSKNILHILSDGSHPLSVLLRQLTEKHGASSAVLVLLEPSGEIGTVIRVTENDCWMLPPQSLPLPAELRTAPEDQRPLRVPDGLWLSLRTGHTGPFGRLFLEGDTGSGEPDEEERQLLSSFSSILYSEAQGGIIASFYPAALRVRGLCVDYGKGEGTVHAVRDVDLDLCEHEFSVIFGSSGCGKTSLLNVIGGMLTPAAGTVTVDGEDVTRLNGRRRAAYRRNSVGFIFQHYNLIRDLTAEENIRIAAEMVPSPLPVGEVLEMVGLKDKGGKYPGQLSGGEQQRVCIARALVKRARFLLCDEPTGALDSENAAHVMTILQGLTRDPGTPVIMITHNPVFSALADHAVYMSCGQVIDELRQPFPLRVRDLKIL